MNRKRIEEELDKLMQKIPKLNDFGIGLYSGHRNLPKEEKDKINKEDREKLLASVDRIKATIDWLDKNVDKIKTINRSRTSYGLKHIAEKDICYITNGVFIASAIIAGYRYKINFGDPNVSFGVSERSIKVLNQKRA